MNSIFLLLASIGLTKKMWLGRRLQKNVLTIQNSIQAAWCYIYFPLPTSSGIPRFWMNPCQTGLVRSHHRPSRPLRNPSHSSQRSPPRPFWALPISCAKLLICLVTSQCFLHRTEGEISTLFGAVNHSTSPLVHWYHHYSIRLYSNSPTFLVITVKSLQGVHDNFMAGIFFFPFNSITFNYKNKQKSYLAVTTHFF